MPHNYLKSPRGTVDILPHNRLAWDKFYTVARATSYLFAYNEIDTPIFEDTYLFSRGIGDHTDIVMKEMYTFPDHGGDLLTLRPEGTAGVCRAYIEHGMHNLPQPLRLFYLGTMYRYERPQAGRLREFRQFGAELIGDHSPAADCEIIEMAWKFLANLGIKDIVVQVNSIGDTEDRNRYNEVLREYYTQHINKLSEKEVERLKRSPLRLLDAKQGAAHALAKDAPKPLNFLGKKASEHFDQLLAMLEDIKAVYEGFEFSISDNLVRGLDYYNRTVFEILPKNYSGQQSTLIGGGRYDPLIESIGGKPTPAVGFAAGADRIVLTLKERFKNLYPDIPPISADIVVVFTDATLQIKAYSLASRLREKGVSAICAPKRASLKAQMRYANQVKAKHTIIVKSQHIGATVILKNLSTGQQNEVEENKITSNILQNIVKI